MVGTTLIPSDNKVSLTIPADMIGRKVKVIAYAIEEEADVIDGLSASLNDSEELYIPQWQKDLVLAEEKRIEDDPSLLVDWEIFRKELSGRK